MFLAVTEKIEEYPLVSLDSVTKLTIIVYSITLQVTAAVVFLCFVWNYFRFVDICNTLYWVHCRLYNKAPEIKDRINAIVVSIATGNIILKIERLKSFMNIYWLLCDTIHQANNFYSGPLTAMMVCSFIHVIIASYYFFLFVRSGDSLSIIVQGVWLLVHICYTVLLFNSSTDVTNSLEAFLIQLPHHNARFSALGFFQIHNESLTTMAGAVTAYMVVLIQFQSDLGST
ncbi:putative gustatory receptor 28b [Homalodisca vitripennis]|uniref:putative gustatory receptor 28b n=1 Tax=Homalodisca vitripennis TaxID=197043 RepID=UPI001EEC634B|nr:putative gustatory receptor 28b [Homalodisca vitripennis]